MRALNQAQHYDPVPIELERGNVVRLRGQGARRSATAISVLGDLHEIARLKA